MSITRRILAGTAIAGAALAFTAGVANADQGRQAADDTAVTASACGQSYTDYVPAGYEQASRWQGQLFDRNTGFSTPAIVDFHQEAAVVTLPEYGQQLTGEARYEQGLRFDTRAFSEERSTIAFRTAEAQCYGEGVTEVQEMRGTAEVAPFMLPVAGQLEFQLHRAA